MIDLYYSATPNGLKLRHFLEESGIDHRLISVHLSKGEQHQPEFLAISPNNKIPAIVDHAPADGGAPLPMFESGAIMLYLAEKYARLIPAASRDRLEVVEWLFWQTSGLGPMGGQAGHFRAHAPEKIGYAIERYSNEVARLYRVLDKRLDGRAFIVGDYSIADIASYSWIVPHRGLGQDLAAFRHLQRWFDLITARPATQRAYAGSADPYAAAPTFTADERKSLFGQSPAR